jgi:hypothetical protein
MEIQKAWEAWSMVMTRRELLKRGLRADVSEISVCEREERRIIIGPPCNFKEDEPFYEPFMEFCSRSVEMGVNLSNPIGGCQESAENFFRAPGQPDRFFSLDPTGHNIVPEGEYLVGYTRGYYGDFNDLPERMLEYAEKHSLELTGWVYSVYLHDELCIKDPSKYLVEVNIAVAKEE